MTKKERGKVRSQEELGNARYTNETRDVR